MTLVNYAIKKSLPALLLGEVGDIDGVLEFEDETQPLPDPGRLDRSQALYCSPPRPDPGLESLEKATLDSFELAI